MISKPQPNYILPRCCAAVAFVHSKNVALLSSVYVEHLDLLVLACEDARVYVWGFDYDAVDALQKLGRENAKTNFVIE